MRVRTAADLGAFIRERRIKLGMGQSDLAEKAGTSRKWTVEVEQGKPRAEIGLVLRTLKTLGFPSILPLTARRRHPQPANPET